MPGMRPTRLRRPPQADFSDAFDPDDGTSPSLPSYANEGAIRGDSKFYEVDQKMDAWLEEFPGGLSELYPHMLVIDPQDVQPFAIQTPKTSSATKPFPLLSLPAELRCMVYGYCMDEMGWSESYVDGSVAFPGHSDDLQYVYLEGECLDLKELLSIPMLRVSRYLRAEALPELFRRTCFVTAQLSSVPRFSRFLGGGGRSLVRYLGVHDAFDCQNQDIPSYHAALSSIANFRSLAHLHVTLDGPSILSKVQVVQPEEPVSVNSLLFVPEEDFEEYWPEYKILASLSTQKFTMSLGIWQFDMATKGPMQATTSRMRANFAQNNSPESALPVTSISSPPESPEKDTTTSNGHEIIDLTLADAVIHDPSNIDTRSLLLYNYLRELWGDQSLDSTVACLPFASKSVGDVHEDCASCYLSQTHCGYHSVTKYHHTAAHADQFQSMSFKEVTSMCTRALCDLGSTQAPVYLEGLAKIFHLQKHLGWPMGKKIKWKAIWSLVSSGDDDDICNRFGVDVWDVVGWELTKGYGHVWGTANELL